LLFYKVSLVAGVFGAVAGVGSMQLFEGVLLTAHVKQGPFR
jgi:hypothetical protein